MTPADIQDDSYLKPVLEDDALILCLDELPDAESKHVSAGWSAELDATDPALGESLLQRNTHLQAELERLSSQFASYKLTVQQTLDQRWGEDEDVANKEAGDASKAKDESESYFESYAHNGMCDIAALTRNGIPTYHLH